MISVHIDAREFYRWLHNARDQLRVNAKQTFGQGVALGVAHARATTKFKDQTGALRKSIDRVPHGEWGWKLRATAPHAVFVEKGTKPHRIEARNARALRYVQHGQIRFSRSVQHPGTKPTHFLDDAATVVTQFLDHRMEEAARRALR